MVRVITQETYDEIVNENIEDFDMTPEEAIKDAIAQFEAQSVDLSNIIKDLALSSGNNHLVSSTVNKLKEISNTRCDGEAVLKELDVLTAECKKDIAHRVRAAKDGAYSVLINLLDKNLINYLQDSSTATEILIIKVLTCLTCLMDMQPDLLDPVGIELIKKILDDVKNETILAANLKWTSTCCLKHEMNRQRIFAKDICSNLKELLNKKENAKLIKETLQVIRKLTFDDDIRVEFGKAHDHAKELGIKLLEPLTDVLIENSSGECTAEVLVTVSSLLVRHELCASAARCSDALFSILADHYDDVVTIQQAIKLIIALAGNDDVKKQLVKSGIVPVVVALLTRHSSNPTAVALILKSIAALSLREPLHSMQFLENDAAEAIVDCLKVHQNNASVQKNGCWAIRNLVARCKEQNVKFHELGVEAILNKSYEVFGKEFGFDIRSALRDLECDVTLDEQWTGKGLEIEQ